jgi:hypothetical protein
MAGLDPAIFFQAADARVKPAHDDRETSWPDLIRPSRREWQMAVSSTAMTIFMQWHYFLLDNIPSIE